MQKRVRVSVSSLEKFLARVMRRLELPRSSVTVCLVPDSQIAEWNEQYRGKDGPTDVLSFPAQNGDGLAHRARAIRRFSRAERVSLGSLREEDRRYLGDIAIAPAVARRNAHPGNPTLDEELRILILHGVLHLMGYDHETDNGQMERLERRLRRRLGLR